MPSIFIWKATLPFSSTVKTVPYYAGSNWFLEDYGSHSKSGIYLDQQALSNDGWMYDIQWMPSNWVGAYVLEKLYVPYSLIRTVEWGTLEHIGNWMRFTTKEYVPVELRESIWKQIQNLGEEPCLINMAPPMKSHVRSFQYGLNDSPKHSPKHSPKYSTKHSPNHFHQKRTNQWIDVQMHV